MGLCSCRTILYNKRGVFRCLSFELWAESSLVVWRGKRGCLLDFRSVKYFSPRCPYVRGPPDGELGTTYRVTCPINSFIFRLENKFPLRILLDQQRYDLIWALADTYFAIAFAFDVVGPITLSPFTNWLWTSPREPMIRTMILIWYPNSLHLLQSSIYLLNLCW